MEIQITHSAPRATSTEVPPFPMVRFDAGLVVYQEVLLDGQFLVANTSAMGRPKPREWLFQALHGGQASDRPLRSRQHAFQLEVDGQLLVDRWSWEGAEEVPDTRPGCRQCAVSLRHTQRPLDVTVHTRLDGTPFLTRWLTLTNTGDRPLPVSQVSPWSAQVWDATGNTWAGAELSRLPSSPFTLGRFTETTWGAEGSFDWMPLPDGTYGYETVKGLSGWGSPFWVVRNEVTGEVCMGAFAWTGNWQVRFYNDHEPVNRYRKDDARLYMQVGMAGPAPLRVLEPGESAVTPEVHVGFLFGDLDACVQALHDHQRRSVILPQPEGREHRVEVNHTGYTRNAQITESQLHEEIDVAADVGVELFMLDAGWFGAPDRNWPDQMGDWTQESPLLPSGVKDVFDRIHARGMLGGIWAPPEAMGEKSDLLRDHPEWQMEKRGEKIRNLDFSKPAVEAYVEETIAGLIERYGLDCYRIDGPSALQGEGTEAEHGGYNENRVWRHYDAFYRIMERIHTRYPNVLLECCAGGGGHTDLGMMSRFHWVQTTDVWSPGPTLKILNGLTLSLPPELCEPLLGAISDGIADIDFMLRIGLFSHFCVSGIFPSMDERQATARERWRHAIQLYKDFCRPILSTSTMFHHTPIQYQREPGDWIVLECAAEDASRAYAAVFRLESAAEPAYRFYPKGLDVTRRYRLTWDTCGQVCEMDGGQLAQDGLRVPVSAPFTSELLLFEALQERM
ncbi:MAG: alpha-galactosidase [Anaerolineae bacterium]